MADGKLRTDLLLDPFGARWPDVEAAARAAADAGFDGIWTWDHLDGRVHGAPHVLECWTTLTAVAATVPQVQIGSLVLNAANRQPGVLAAMASTLQEVSGGRLLLGLGAGGGRDTPYAREQHVIGRDVPGDVARRARLEATIGELRRLWSTAGFRRPAPPPPIVVGGFGPKMAELAGRVADGFNTQAFHPRLEHLVMTARAAFGARPQDDTVDDFAVSVFAGFDPRWVRAGSPARERLERLGVSRVILVCSPPYDTAAIVEAARTLPSRS